MGKETGQHRYQGQWRHARVTLASVWFPSSRARHAVKASLKREWMCRNRRTTHDRNLNAAAN